MSEKGHERPLRDVGIRKGSFFFGSTWLFGAGCGDPARFSQDVPGGVRAKSPHRRLRIPGSGRDHRDVDHAGDHRRDGGGLGDRRNDPVPVPAPQGRTEHWVLVKPAVKAFGAAGEAPQGENHERRRRQHGQGDPQDPEADEHKTRDDQQRTPNRWLAQCRTCPGGIARSPFRGRLPAIICRAARSGSSPVSGAEPQQGT